MDKNKIIEVAFETIKNSTEWGIDCEDKTYGNWIDGVVTVVDNIIESMGKNDMEEQVKNVQTNYNREKRFEHVNWQNL